MGIKNIYLQFGINSDILLSKDKCCLSFIMIFSIPSFKN